MGGKEKKGKGNVGMSQIICNFARSTMDLLSIYGTKR